MPIDPNSTGSVMQKDLVSAVTAASAAGAGSELAYVEAGGSQNIAIQGTTAAGATVIVTAPALVFDGAARIKVEFCATAVFTGANAVAATWILLFDGATDLGWISLIQGNAIWAPCYGVRILTPSSGSHTYSIRGYRNAVDGGISNNLGAGDIPVPCFIRITRA